MQRISDVANNMESFCTCSVFKGKNTLLFSMKFYERLLFSGDSWTPSHGSYLGIYSQMSDDTSRCVSMSVTQVSYSSAKAPFHLLNVPFVVYCRKAIYPCLRSQYLYTEWLTTGMLDLAINRSEITWVVVFFFYLGCCSLFTLYILYTIQGKHMVRKMLPSHNTYFP